MRWLDQFQHFNGCILNTSEQNGLNNPIHDDSCDSDKGKVTLSLRFN